jgi:erythromycin esterase
MSLLNLGRWIGVVALIGASAACGSDSSTGSGTGADVLVPGLPDGWGGGASSTSSYQIGVNRTTRHGGGAAAYIKSVSSAPTSFATINQGLNASPYRGKRLRWSAWVMTQSVNGSDVGLWMRVDGADVTTAFDNMSSRPLSGTADWHQVSIVLDVAPSALGIAVGALMNGTGTLLVDDVRLEVVGTDVPVTALGGGTPTSDSATVAAFYGRSPSAPVNADFEGVTGVSAATISWLSSNLTPLTTTDPLGSLDDLAPLKQMIGSAHLIGLGEGTHGTREFFRMKHRILEYLVKEMGATYFAIEATTPESDDMNQYVLNGIGDPKRLLSRLYFWTWNTQEVLDMVVWMHQWNTTAPAGQRVQFLGFDMQAPGAAMDSVTSFIARVDSGQSSTVAAAYACLAPYRNHAQTSGAAWSGYAAQSAAAKGACAGGLQQVYSLIDSRRAAYEAATSPTIYQNMLHDARLVQQFEADAALSNNAGAASLSRDKSMAENIGWIRDRAPAGARIVLWAHNGHITGAQPYMGGYLRSSYGADYVNLGFAFGHGFFNAVGTTGLQPWDAEIIPANSLEAMFAGTAKAIALLDTRLIAGGGTAAAPLAGPVPMRSIGAAFDPGSERAYFGSALFPTDFNLVVYVNATTASTLLPFTY